MSRIRAKNTNPEMIVRRPLFARGFRYLLHVDRLPGKPDIVFPKFKTVVFVHGCFWHAHPGCKRSVTPKSNKDYWIPKIERNRNPDKLHEEKLEVLGWKFITIWECQTKKQLIEGKIQDNTDFLKVQICKKN